MATYLQLPISGGINGSIRIENIYTVLEVSPRTVGYDLGYICCNQHGKTNMWARYKPEGIGGPAPITEAQRKANNYGLKPSDNMRGYKPNMDATNGIPALSAVTWRYVPPTSTQWHRITDWAGYEVQASAPTAPVGDIEFPLNVTEIQIYLTTPKISTVNSLKLEDFGYCQDMYFCVVIWTRNKSTGATKVVNYKTANSKIGDTLAADKTSVKFTRSELTVADKNLEIHYTSCFSTNKSTGWGAINDTTLYPLVTNVPPTAQIIMSTSSPVKFHVEGVANLATAGYKANSLELYNMATTTPNGLMQVTALGVTGNSGSVTFFGYFETTSSLTLPYPASPIECTMRPTITGTVAKQHPNIFLRNTDGTYTQAARSITIPANQKVYAALEFRSIAFIPREGAVPVQPGAATYDKYTSGLFTCVYQASGTSSITAPLFNRGFNVNVWQGYDDKIFVVNHLAEPAT